MSLLKLAALAGLSLLGLASPCVAQERRIIWTVVDWPPMMILKNKEPQSFADLGDGLVDNMLRQLVARMPAYRHELQTSTVRRSMALMKKGENVCYPMALKTPEREKFAYFTSIQILVPPQLTVREDRLKALALGEPPISLAALQARADIKGVLVDKRSYGAAIDALPSSDRLERILIADDMSLLKMLDGGRMDYAVEYPQVVEYARRQSGLRSMLVSLPLVETAEPLIGYFACTRNAWGAAVMRDLDQAIRESAHDKAFRELIWQWLPADQRPRYEARFEEFFTRRAAASAFKAD